MPAGIGPDTGKRPDAVAADGYLLAPAVEGDGYGVLTRGAAVGEPGGIACVAAGAQRSYRVERADSG